MGVYSSVKQAIAASGVSRLAGAFVRSCNVAFECSTAAPRHGPGASSVQRETINAVCYYVSRTQDSLVPTMHGCDTRRMSGDVTRAERAFFRSPTKLTPMPPQGDSESSVEVDLAPAATAEPLTSRQAFLQVFPSVMVAMFLAAGDQTILDSVF